MFTRQHYKAIAEILQSEYTRYDGTGEDDGEGKNTVGCIAGKLSDYFITDNPQFNRQKFLDACLINNKRAKKENWENDNDGIGWNSGKEPN